MAIRVLVVEDDEAVAEALELALETEHTVTVARNGREALDAIDATPVDVIILDLMMPVMDGEELMGHLRDAGITTPVIVASAGRDLERRCRALGAADFVQKPYTLVELLAKIYRLTGGGPGGAAAPRPPSEPPPSSSSGSSSSRASCAWWITSLPVRARAAPPPRYV
jgi:DNA-binding response OmpR family regulator